MMMTRVTLLGLIALACLTNACSFGMTARKYPPAQGPQGVTLSVETEQGRFSGELIEVRDAGIVLLVAKRLRLLPYSAILSSEVAQTSARYAISKKTAPKPDVREHLRLLSRFPQGLTPELTQQLLAANGQTELAGVNP